MQCICTAQSSVTNVPDNDFTRITADTVDIALILRTDSLRRIRVNCFTVLCRCQATGVRTSHSTHIHCVSKNDTNVAHYNFDADQPILISFGRDVAERVRYQTMICYPTSSNYICLCTTWGNMNAGDCVFPVILYSVPRKQNV